MVLGGRFALDNQMAIHKKVNAKRGSQLNILVTNVACNLTLHIQPDLGQFPGECFLVHGFKKPRTSKLPMNLDGATNNIP